MKNIFFSLLIIISSTSFSQESINAKVDSTSSSKSYQSYSVDIPQTTLKDIQNDWLKYIAEGNKGKASFVNGEYIQAGAVNKNISPNPFTLYSRLVEIPGGTRITAWLAESNVADAARGAKNDQNLAVQKMLHDFAVTSYRAAVKDELKVEQNKLADLEKDLKSVIKDEDKSTKAINANERSNERADDAISTNKGDINRATEKISDQKVFVQQTAADPNAKKGAQKTLAEMENDKKDLQKQNEKQNKNIDSRNKENRVEDRNMVAAQQSQEIKIAAIEKQKVVVANVQAKLDNIK